MSDSRGRPAGRYGAVIGVRISTVLATVLAAAACTGAGGQGQAGTPKAANTIELTLIAGKTTDNSSFFNFNGFSNGKMSLTVPTGWAVVVHYQNFSPLRHSFDVIPYTGKQPDAPPPPPVFKGATTKDPVSGIGLGKEEPSRLWPTKLASTNTSVGWPAMLRRECGIISWSLPRRKPQASGQPERLHSSCASRPRRRTMTGLVLVVRTETGSARSRMRYGFRRYGILGMPTTVFITG